MSKPKDFTYQPKGSMCSACGFELGDCSNLDFKDMRVIEKIGSTKIVKCDQFYKKETEEIT